MPLGKRELLRIIKTEEDYLDYLKKNLKDIENGKFKHEDPEYQKIESCSNSVSTIVHESRIEVLNEILIAYYQPKKRKPTKLEFLEACLEYVEKRIPKFKSKKRHRYKTTWKFFLVNELKEKIEKLRKLKKIRTEIKEVS